MKKIYLVLLIFILILSSCASMFNSAVLPNQCKKCELIDNRTGEILFTKEGCGGENTRLEEEAQIEAYLRSRGSFNLCDLEVKCSSWRKSPDTE